MAKRTKSDLDFIKSFVDNTYNRYGNRLLVNVEKPYDPGHSNLGYCYKFIDPSTNNVVYKIDCSKIGIDHTDFRIMLHEYGHIYLGHLDGIHEDLDTQICNVLRDYRGELIDAINYNCGIDFADKLLQRVIDDPMLNHSLHNIAMDMEVNSQVLSKEDIEEMEMDITSILPKYEEEALKYAIDNAATPEQKKALEDALKKMGNEAKIKLIIPERYYLSVDPEHPENNVPFPNDLTYAEYLILIIKHLDQFVKMLVSLKMGGNGDTSQVSQQDIQDMLKGKSDEYKQGYQQALQDYQNGQVNPQNGNTNQQNQNQGQGQGQGQQNDQSQSQEDQGSSQGQGQSSDYQQGYQDALNDIANGTIRDPNGMGNGMQSLDDLMNDMGMSNSNQQKGRPDGSDSPYKGTRDDVDFGKDHRTDSRDVADKKRELGQIHSGGGTGCGSSGNGGATRETSKDVDEVDMALQEVMRNVRNRVIKMNTKKDNMKLYNRGVIRSVIAPSITRKVTISNEPKIAFLIDISGSMNTRLVDRILKTIGISMKRLSHGLKYDIITWNTGLGEHIKDVNPKKGVPRISMGGGTRLAKGIQYFKDNYGPEAILIVISDFEDYLEEWHEVEKTMNNYSLYGFNYGCSTYYDSDKIDWKNMKIRKFNS